MRKLYIQTLPTEQIGIVEEDGIIKELVVNRPDQTNLVGNIYVGKVMNIEKGLQAAFVDIGQQKLGFLQRKELPGARKNPNLPIESLITEGQKLLVQIQKDAYGDKGARVTANVTIPGLAVVYLPYWNHVAASKKLAEAQRNELKDKINPILENDEGAIIRTSARDSSVDTIYQEFLYLREKWKKMEQVSNSKPVPSSVYVDYAIPDRLIRKFPPNTVKAIYLDRSEQAVHVRQAYPYVKDIVFWDKQLEQRLSASINQILADVVDPSVVIQGGIELQIEQTEALTVIDVDTGGYTGKWNKNQTIVHVNCQAAREIARQLRLRNLAGIIIIDFIDMKSEADQKQVIKALKSELANDLTHSEILGFTKLGLLEMTRKRESFPLSDALLDQEGKKYQFSYQTYAFMLERELLSYQNSQAEAIYIEVHPSVYSRFVEMIDIDQLKQAVHQQVFVKKLKGMASYQIKLAGSDQLIEEHIANKNGQGIDKLF